MSEHVERVRALWDGTAESPWYASLRAAERINAIAARPCGAFEPHVWKLLQGVAADFRGLRVLIPSSGDNHAAFAFAQLGAIVTSTDISERQLAHARAIAGARGWDIAFCRQDSMRLEVEAGAYDLVYTSNGTHVWLNDLAALYAGIRRALRPGGAYVLFEVHPFQRPFAGDRESARIVKPYADTVQREEDVPHYHWRVQDFLNAQADAGLALVRLLELADADGSFWFDFEQRQRATPGEVARAADWHKNPIAALPVWLAVQARAV